MAETAIRSPRVLLAVSGSIAAYRAADIVSGLVQRGVEVQCVLTKTASEFVSPLVLETLSGRQAISAVFGPAVSGTEHIRLAQWPDLIVAAPATANFIARLALGFANDLPSTVALASRAQLMIAPAMNTAMWEHPAVQQNLATLVSRGARVVAPASGTLACGDVGVGKLAAADDIVSEVMAHLAPADLAGLSLLITAGPTTSAIDAVRYVTNHSTGKMGVALAEAAALRGADVKLVLGVDKGTVRPSLPVHSHGTLETVEVRTANEMRDAALTALPCVQGVIAAAAVLDYEVAQTDENKRRRSTEPISLELSPSVDVLGSLVAARVPGQWFMGFAAETEDVEISGEAKLKRKGLDLLFANRVACVGESIDTGFGGETNGGVLLSATGGRWEFEVATKVEIANQLLTRIRNEVNAE